MRHTCDDADVSPALTWSNVPSDTVELAITVTDLDADNFSHWVVTGIDPRTGAKRINPDALPSRERTVTICPHADGVTSADGNAQMLVKAFENARQHGHVMRTVHADWRWLNRGVHDQLFDAVICLGNSFTHLFEDHDRRRALAEFYAVLKHDGMLVLDQRNYDRILDKGFASKHKYYYCGEKVSAEPVHVDEGLARFEYKFDDGTSHHLNMFPLRKDYMIQLLHDAGFQKVETYGDFQESYSDTNPDFYVHVAYKAYNHGE